MSKRELRMELARRSRYVGCQRCGAVDRPLRNYEHGKICPECRRALVSRSDTERSQQ